MALDSSIQDIKKNRLFTGVKDSILTSFFDQKEIKEAEEGDLLYKTGDSGSSIFLIIMGEVKVKFPNQNYITTKIHNDFFGEKEFVEGTKRISSAMAFSRLLYFEIDKKAYSKLLRKSKLIEENINAFGEFKLPKSVIDFEKKFNIKERDKPVSYRLTPDGKKVSEEFDADAETPSVMTQQLLPDLESIENSFEEEELDSTLENIELDKALEELQQLNVEEQEENFDIPDEEVIQESTESEENIVEEEPELAEETPTYSTEERTIQPDTVESGINREIVRKILLALNRLYSGISITELLKNTKRALKDLTNSENTEIIFVEEKLLRMYKVIVKDNKTKNEYFEISEGLTGLCANEKRPINFERPTEDHHYNSNIDNPGSAGGKKRILYFPIISDAGETVAVLQTARDSIKFTENEILYLTMISKQLETAITRTKIIKQMLNAERINSGKKLRETIEKEIRISTDIVESYIKILHSKNLIEEVDDLMRMIHKQSSSLIDLTDSIFKILVNEIVLDDTKLHFNEFIDDVLELLSEYCESKDVKLFKKIGSGALVDIDRSKMYTAIFQFIKAAVADSRKGDRIYLSTELSGDTISIAIQNEGKGVIAVPSEELIDYFYSNENNEESGVNLLIAKKIIEAHSGQVEVESIKGVGCNIKIVLPVTR